MKTPEEIKKGLECCFLECDDTSLVDHCKACPYQPTGICFRTLLKDALAYIRQLEMLAQPNNQIRWERDVAVDQLRQLGVGFGEKIEAQVPKWISVEERLPEYGDVVLVAANGNPKPNVTLHNATLIASYWAEEGWIADGFEGWDTLQVTHWMPLPELPKEG